MQLSFIEITDEEAAASKRVLFLHFIFFTFYFLHEPMRNTFFPTFAFKLIRLAPTTWMTARNLYFNLKLIR